MWQFSGFLMPQGILITQEHPVSGPICFARNDLPIELWHLAVTPGVPKSGTNWQFLGHFRANVH
jgi:hypothetical protein